MTMTTDNSNKILNAPDLRFPEYTDKWAESELHEIATISKGTGISKDQLSDIGEPCILYGELYTKYKSEVIENVISKTDIDTSNLVRSKANDVIIPSSGETAIDISTARCVPYDNILLGGDLNILRLKDQDGRFFCYQLNGVRKLDIAKIAQGVSVVHLYGESLKKLRVFYPSKTEQNKISSFLTLLDEHLEAQSRAIEKLQSLISGLQESILWQNHKRVSFSEIFIERNERTSVINQYEVLSSTAKGIYRQSDYFDKEVASTNNVGYKVLHKGDIVLSPQNLWLGNINYNDAFEIGMVSPSYKVFSIRKQFNPVYVASILKTHRALFEYASASEQGASIVRRNLNMDAFMAICVPIPSKDTQDQIAKLFLSLNQKLKNEVQMLECFNKQKAFLLSHMFI